VNIQFTLVTHKVLECIAIYTHSFTHSILYPLTRGPTPIHSLSLTHLTLGPSPTHSVARGPSPTHSGARGPSPAHSSLGLGSPDEGRIPNKRNNKLPYCLCLTLVA